MRALHVLAIAVSATTGCDQVFGLEGRFSDAEVAVTITGLEILGTPPTIEEMRDVRANMHGPPNSRQTYALSATAGTVMPAGGTIELDDNGDGAITAVYQSEEPGMITLSAMADGDSTMVTFEVLDLVVLGREFGLASTPLATIRYYGGRIRLATQSEVRAIGVTMNSFSGTLLGKFAIYADRTGGPGTKVADLSTAQPIAPGRNRIAIPFTVLPAGDYWLVGIFNRDYVQLVAEPVALAAWGTAPGSFTNAMPATVSGFALMPDVALAFFFIVVPQ